MISGNQDDSHSLLSCIAKHNYIYTRSKMVTLLGTCTCTYSNYNTTTTTTLIQETMNTRYKDNVINHIVLERFREILK